jgi:hypothetical protein
MKKHRTDEPTGIIVHIYMEISQENSLCSHLYLKQAKMSFFSFLPLQNQRTGERNRSWRGRRVATTGWGGGGGEKG